MRRNDIENIARILRKRSPVRVGTIVGFENDGKVVCVRFHDTKLPEGQFERKLACEGIIEGSAFTLIQPNFRRPVSDLIDIEKEIGAGRFNAQTFPLAGFESYPEGSEDPDYIVGLFEMPGGEIYREVLTEKSHNILIPGYGTFPSQKVFGQDVIKRIDVVPWFGPLKMGEHFRLATITNKLKELTTIDGQPVSGFPYVDKIASIRSDTDKALFSNLPSERFADDVLFRSGPFDEISEDQENRHLLYVSGARLFFCEGVAAFEYWKRMWLQGAFWWSQSPYPLEASTYRGFRRSRVFNVWNENGIYTKRYGAVPWLCAWFYPDPYGMGTTSALYNIHGYFAVEKISYDLSKNTVKVTGSSNWLENPVPYLYSGYLGTTSYEIEFLNDPEIPAGLAIVSKKGDYFGFEQVVPASDYENNSTEFIYSGYAPESEPTDLRVKINSSPQVTKFYYYDTRHLDVSEQIVASGPAITIIDKTFEIETQETQVLLGLGAFKPHYIVDIPERMNEIATPDGLVHLWFVTKPHLTPVMIPHLESNDTGIVQSFLTPEEWEKDEKDKTEIELKLSNIDLPVEYDSRKTQLLTFNYFDVKIPNAFAISKLDGVGDFTSWPKYFREIVGMLGLGIRNWNYDVRVFDNYGAYGGNYKIYGGNLDWVQVRELYFKGTIVDGKPYKVTPGLFDDPNLLMDHSYGERSLDDYGYNPANGGSPEQTNTYKTALPKYDTGANATYRYDPDDLIVEVDHVDVYKIVGASYDHWTGRWNWTWESEPCRTVPGSEVEKVEPYPRIRVPILAEELTQISGRWHLPRLHIYYKRLKAGTYGLNVVPYFYIHFRNPIEALAEFPTEEAKKVLFPQSCSVFNPRLSRFTKQFSLLSNTILVVPKDITYGQILFPETDDPLFNEIRNDMTGIVAADGIQKFFVYNRDLAWNSERSDYYQLNIEGPEGKDEVFVLPLAEGSRSAKILYKIGSSEKVKTLTFPEEMFQGSRPFAEVPDSDAEYPRSWYELPADFKFSRLRFDRAKLVFPKLFLQDDLSSTVINLEKYGIEEA